MLPYHEWLKSLAPYSLELTKIKVNLMKVLKRHDGVVNWWIMCGGKWKQREKTVPCKTDIQLHRVQLCPMHSVYTMWPLLHWRT